MKYKKLTYFIANLNSLNIAQDFAFKKNCLKLRESLRYSETQFHSTAPLLMLDITFFFVEDGEEK